MKAQRLKITESGWANYSDVFAGVQFTNGLSDDPVAPAIANLIGSMIRVEAVDDGAQVGMAKVILDQKSERAVVVVPMSEKTPETVAPAEAAAAVTRTVYTKEDLEAVADKDGIAGLRAIAESYGVKGRGIVELITEILKAQG